MMNNKIDSLCRDTLGWVFAIMQNIFVKTRHGVSLHLILNIYRREFSGLNSLHIKKTEQCSVSTKIFY